jgi:hypothetical protein
VVPVAEQGHWDPMAVTLDTLGTHNITWSQCWSSGL